MKIYTIELYCLVRSFLARQLTKQLILRINLITFFIAVAFINVSASVKGQVISLKANGMPVEKFFDVVKKQSGYGFWYEKKTIERAGPVTLSVTNQPLKNVLDTYLDSQDLSYTIVDRTIFIKAKEKGIIDRIGDFFQQITVSGKIVDQKGQPIAGANITLKGTAKTVVSNNNGTFSIIVPGKGSVLQFRYVGYQTTEFTVTDDRLITVSLKEEPAQLNEVSVISNGYETISKERATGAVTVITAKTLEETPTINLMERLEGKVPGVKFDLKSNTIQIRSVNGYTNNSAPLIVIDGFPMIAKGDVQSLTNLTNSGASGNSLLSNFNPADIEQITFLKDAAATSIWGARGANGVIVIDTKKGKKGTTSLNFGYTLGISEPQSLSKLKWMNSAQYVDLEKEMVTKGFLIDPQLTTGSNALYVPNNSEATEWMYRVNRGTATAAQRDAALAEISSRNNQSQIENLLLQQAVSKQYNLSVSGGSDHTSYYISGNYNADQPIYKNNSASNAFLNTSTNTDLFNKRVTIRTGLNYQYSKSIYNGAAANALSVATTALRPYDLLEDASGNTIKRNVIFINSIANSLVAQGYLPFSYNDVDELNYSNLTGKTNQVRLTAGVNGKIFSWLNLDVSGMSQRTMSNTTSINDINSYASRILVNTGTTVGTNGKLVYGVPYGGTYTMNDGNSYDNTLRGQLNLNKSWNKNQVVAIAGTELRETYNKSYSSNRYGYNGDTNTSQVINPTTPYNTFYNYTTTLGDPLGAIAEKKSRYFSSYANASYTYDNKYIVSGSVRFDDYTLLGVDRSKRAIPLWSAGLKWNAKGEKFLQQLNWLSGLSLRTTLGIGGSVPLAGSNITVVSVSGTDIRTGQPVATINTPGNEDLGWETTKTLNGGVDASVFNGRLSFSFDIYGKKSKGILTTVPYNATYGWSSLQFNTATLSSHGLEFGISGQVIRSRSVNWNSIFNFGYNTNKVTDNRFINTTSNIVGSSTVINGLPVNYLYVYRSAGLDSKGQTQIYDRNNNIISNTTNLTSAFNRDDLKYAGVTQAPYSGGFFNNVTYKDFTFGMQITYYMGHVFLKQSVTNYPTFEGSYSGVIGRQEDLAYRWRNPGDEAFTSVPGLTGINFNSINRYRYSDQLVRKADNIRLQQISVAYNVPQKYLPGRVFKSLSVSANMRNVALLWTANKEGIDPQYISTGIYSSLSPAPSYVFGLNASF